MPTTRHGGVLLALVALLTVLVPAQAEAKPNPWKQMQKEIDHQLRTTKGGVQTSPNEISYRRGTVVMVFVLPGDSTVTQTSARIARGEAPGGEGRSDVVSGVAYWNNCPYAYIGGPDWYCFFEHINYAGRMLKWSNVHCHDGVIDFWNWNFENTMSSMVNNNKGLFVRAEDYEFSDAGSHVTLTGSATRSSMPLGYNDEAEHADACRR